MPRRKKSVVSKKANRSRRSDGNLKCTSCGGEGHYYSACPNMNVELADKSPCTEHSALCRAVGHSESACPEVNMDSRSVGKVRYHRPVLTDMPPEKRLRSSRIEGFEGLGVQPQPVAYIPTDPESIEDMENLRSVCAGLGVTIQEVPASAGDCMYAVIQRSLDSNLAILNLREIAFSWLRVKMDAERWAPSGDTGPQTFEDYLNAIKVCAYGDEYSLMALSDVMQFDYTILSSDGFVHQSNRNFSRRVFMGYLKRAQHYMLMTINGNSPWLATRTGEVVVNSHVADIDKESVHGIVHADMNAVPSDMDDALDNDIHEPSPTDNVMGHCENCMRSDVEGLQLDLQTCQYIHHRRNFGQILRKEMACYVLCDSCRTFFESDSVNAKNASIPSRMYSILVGKKRISESQIVPFMRIIPKEWKNSWKWIMHTMKHCFRDQWDVDGVRDMSAELEKFQFLHGHDSIQEVLRSLTEYPVPTVLCPLGCHVHLSDIQSYPMLPLFLNVSGAEHSLQEGVFLSMRSDWPYVAQLLKWRVCGGIIVDDGVPRVLFCKEHSRATLGKKFVHVPRHPTLSSAPLHPDILAPATVVPNIIRAPRMGKWTNSAHVVKEISVGGSGMSSFAIQPAYDFPKMNVTDEENEVCDKLIFDNRPDIRKISHDRIHVNYADDLDLKHPSVPENKITKALSGSSMVSLEDAYRNWRYYQDRVSDKDRALGTICDTEAFRCGNQVTWESVSIVNIESVFMDTCLALRHFCHQWSSMQASDSNELTKVVNALYKSCSKTLSCANNKVKASCSKNLAKLLMEMGLEDDFGHLRGFVPKLIETFTSVVFGNPLLAMDSCQDSFKDHIVLLVKDGDPAEDSVIDALDLTETHFLQGRYLQGVCFVRPSAAFPFEEMSYRKCKVAVDESKQLLVYCPVVGDNLYASIKDSLQKVCSRVVCGYHNRCLDMVQKSTEYECGDDDCDRPVAAKCLSGHDIPDCAVGLCARHARELNSCTDKVLVYCHMKPTNLRATSDIADVNDGECCARYEGDDVDGDVALCVSDDGDDDVVLADLAVGVNQEMVLGPVPVFADVCQIPIFDVTRRSLPGQFYVNDCLNVLKRTNRWTRSYGNPILSSIVSLLSEDNVCVLFPEAMLFPRIFWKYNSDLQSFPGALPSYFFFEGGQFENKDAASIRDHMRVRLRDFSSLTSRTPAYHHFWFDVLVNSVLQHTTASFIASRGFEFVSEIRNPGWKGESLYSFDEETASRKRKELSHLTRVGKWDYFVTLTCNDTLTPGVAQIHQALVEAAGYDSHKLLGLEQEYRILKLTAWRRTVKTIMNYITTSSEEPLGRILTYFLRWEFQSSGAIGNKPHVHCGLTLDNPAPGEAIKRICCKPDEMFNELFGMGQQSLADKGLIDDKFGYADMLDLSVLYRHSCDKATARCMRRDAEGNEKCRVQVHPPSNVYWYEIIPAMKMDEKLESILLRLDLARIGSEGEIILDKSLQTGRWHYPSNGVVDRASPTIPFLAAVFKASTNVQFCDHKFATEYLIKYCTKRESHAYTYNKTQNFEENVALQSDVVRNFGYYSERKAQEKQDAAKNPIAKDMSFDEVLWNLLGFEYSESNVENVHVPTYPPEFRGGVLKYSSGGRLADTTRRSNANEERSHLPEWRQFSQQQCLLAKEYQESKFYVDNTSKFNVRPPELVVFSNIMIFFRFFVRSRKRVSSPNIVEDLAQSAWIDGLGFEWRIRSRYINDAVTYLNNLAEHNETAEIMLEEIFRPLSDGQNEMLSMRYVSQEDRGLVVVNTSLIRPTAISQFLYHLCLTMGDFVTELQWACQGSALECLYNCNLLTADGDTKTELDTLFKRYVETDLKYYPMPSQQFAKALKATERFFDGLLTDNFQCDYTLAEGDIIQEAKTNLEVFWKETSENVVEAARAMGIVTPDFDGLDLSYQPTISRCPGQTDASFQEQKKAFAICKGAIDDYLPRDKFVRLPMLTGAPGTGKTHIMMSAALYALSRGQKVMITSLTGERARSLGGLHFHLYLNVPVGKGSFVSPQFLIQGCFKSLQRNPQKLAKVIQTDILFIDEVGMFNSELVTILDKVLQMVMMNEKPFGGKLLISSGDCLQLPPINGHSLWISMYMLTAFKVFDFREYVRSAGDDALRKALTLLRKPVMEEEDVSELQAILRDNCRFVGTWNDVPNWAMRIVATRDAEQSVVNKFIAGLMTQGVTLMEFDAIDEVSNETGVWKPGHRWHANLLNRDVLEAEKLTLYKGACVRMTYNSNAGVVFSQGQLAIVEKLPQSNDATLRLIMIPPGCHNFETVSDEWQRISVHKHTAQVECARSNQQIRRTQWPVIVNLGSTIHKVIGLTCEFVGTELNQAVPNLKLWQKEQLLVLISRVKRLKNLYFVGSQTAAMNCVEFLCLKEDQWRNFIYEVVCQSSVNKVQDADIRLSPFQSFYSELPNAECVYVIYSPSTKRCYVGQTGNFVRRLRQHNGGYGAQHTMHGRPWGCAGLVTGIEGGEQERFSIEGEIHHEIGRHVHLRPRELLQAISLILHRRNARRSGAAINELKLTSFIA